MQGNHGNQIGVAAYSKIFFSFSVNVPPPPLPPEGFLPAPPPWGGGGFSFAPKGADRSSLVSRKLVSGRSRKASRKRSSKSGSKEPLFATKQE